MVRLVLRRVVLAIPVLFIVSALTYVLTAITPGDPGRTLLGTHATPQAVAAFDRSLGLDQPLYQQYWKWLDGVLHGNLGKSVFSAEPVTRILASGLPVTLTLIIGATLVAACLGVPLGIATTRLGGRLGRAADSVSTVGLAIPSFWLGFLLIILFSQTFHLVPPGGWVPLSQDPAEWARLSILPVLTLGISGVAMVAKQTREGMLAELRREYVRALRARGISERAVLYKHALRNALPNVVTLLGLYVVGLLLGSTLVESVFSLQGLGSLAVQATSRHDLPILQGVGIYFVVIVFVAFCLTDLLRGWLNPRLRSGS